MTLLHSSRSDQWLEGGRRLQLAWPGYLQLVAVGTRGRFRDPSCEWLQRYGLEPDGAVLVRPDGHVAWRSRSAVADPVLVLDRALRQALALVF